jgi:hypothetical protein
MESAGSRPLDARYSYEEACEYKENQNGLAHRRNEEVRATITRSKNAYPLFFCSPHQPPSQTNLPRILRSVTPRTTEMVLIKQCLRDAFNNGWQSFRRGR